ncbi:hypothetical protein DXG03_009626 [Asterophora parasitica]|uniref:Uncharacterized protein n=1 Tax=Asterophora parasitica TaxID=117018 RepID=A0A9P7G7X7_9AGAR|nr:hypothetical protein DXG03_009626 [Asterophora parasitica]
MARKQMTYAHKRNRNKPLSRQTYSSPLCPIPNPDAQLTHPEMSRRMLKRSRQSGSMGSADSTGQLDMDTGNAIKKSKLQHHDAAAHGEGGDGMATHELLRTPHPTSLTEEQVFKLQSSRGQTLSPDHEFSPVPLAPSQRLSKPSTPAQISSKSGNHHSRTKLMQRTSSRNLKENATPPISMPSSRSTTRPSASTTSGRKDSRTSFQHTTRSKPKKTQLDEAPLASPFASHPSSPCSPPGEHSISKARTTKRTLSDTHYNPNLPSHRTQIQSQTQSTSNSPANPLSQAEHLLGRRPSAPSATAERPDVASWFVSHSATRPHVLRDGILSPNIFDLSGRAPSRGTPVDFNRPPSQLAYHFNYDEAFAGDALAISTPFGTKAQSMHSLESPDSTDDEDDDTRRGSRLVTLSLGPWMSDSLISPPTLSREAHNQPPGDDVDMDLLDQDIPGGDDDSLALGQCPVSSSPGYSGERPRTHQERQADLQELFDSLDLGFGGGSSRPPVSRTRSLGLEPDRSQGGQPLQSPAQISPSKSRIPVPSSTSKDKRVGRERRGTIRASDFAAAQASNTAVAGAPRRTRSGTVVQGPAAPRRERSGTILARPPASTLVSKAAAASVDGDVNMGDAPQERGDVLMAGPEDESDDEMQLLSGHWCDGAWAVAEPPSPKVTRRSNAKAKLVASWKKKHAPGRGLGTWGMKEHDEDDGEDDPLLLK